MERVNASDAEAAQADAERIRALFTRRGAADGEGESGEDAAGYRFARWGRALSPAVFGADERGAAMFADAVAAAAAPAGLEVVEEDPEFGANLLFFLCQEWAELKSVPSMERLIPDISRLTAILAAAGANQYRIFSFAPDGAIRLAVVLIRYDRDMASLPGETIALSQAMQSLLLWSETAFTTDSPVVSGAGGRGSIEPWHLRLIQAAYAEGAPGSADDPGHAADLAARMATLAEAEAAEAARAAAAKAAAEGGSDEGASEQDASEDVASEDVASEGEASSPAAAAPEPSTQSDAQDDAVLTDRDAQGDARGDADEPEAETASEAAASPEGGTSDGRA